MADGQPDGQQVSAELPSPPPSAGAHHHGDVEMLRLARSEDGLSRDPSPSAGAAASQAATAAKPAAPATTATPATPATAPAPAIIKKPSLEPGRLLPAEHHAQATAQVPDTEAMSDAGHPPSRDSLATGPDPRRSPKGKAVDTDPRRSPKGKAVGTDPRPDSCHSGADSSADPVCLITLLLPTGPRHPYKLDLPYLSKRGVDVPRDPAGHPDLFAISVYKLKELILREWRDDWDAAPASPGSIRLIFFGKLLDDKESLKRYNFSDSKPNVIHMSVRPPEIADDDEGGKAKAGASAGGGSCCVIL